MNEVLIGSSRYRAKKRVAPPKPRMQDRESSQTRTATESLYSRASRGSARKYELRAWVEGIKKEYKLVAFPELLDSIFLSIKMVALCMPRSYKGPSDGDIERVIPRIIQTAAIVERLPHFTFIPEPLHSGKFPSPQTSSIPHVIRFLVSFARHQHVPLAFTRRGQTLAVESNKGRWQDFVLVLTSLFHTVTPGLFHSRAACFPHFHDAKEGLGKGWVNVTITEGSPNLKTDGITLNVSCHAWDVQPFDKPSFYTAKPGSYHRAM
ncbi:hypothetical protein BKA70DRAFT_1398588 [Coprinopsis sp. MPI-PUGE-AT-0042]|nr:hypothetical protein BKA70DRAFT_1398588 [Coprinopsis sp. MPI-PUGE-AT-0042]